MSIQISSGNQYSYEFVMQDGKTLQKGNCIVTNINVLQIQFTDTNTKIPYVKKLADVKFGPVKNRGK